MDPLREPISRYSSVTLTVIFVVPAGPEVGLTDIQEPPDTCAVQADWVVKVRVCSPGPSNWSDLSLMMDDKAFWVIRACLVRLPAVTVMTAVRISSVSLIFMLTWTVPPLSLLSVVTEAQLPPSETEAVQAPSHVTVRSYDVTSAFKVEPLDTESWVAFDPDGSDPDSFPPQAATARRQSTAEKIRKRILFFIYKFIRIGAKSYKYKDNSPILSNFSRRSWANSSVFSSSQVVWNGT